MSSTRSPRVSPRKGHRPRVPVLSQIDHYQKVMNILMKSLVVRDDDHAKNLRDSMYIVAESVFRAEMQFMEPHRPTKDAPLDKKIQFNDSVTRLRTVHNQVMVRVRKLQPKKEEVYAEA